MFDSQDFFSSKKISPPKDAKTPIKSPIPVSPSSSIGSSSLVRSTTSPPDYPFDELSKWSRTSTSAAPAMNQAAIQQLIDDGVAAALEVQAANMANTGNTNRNPEQAPVARKLFSRSNCTEDCKVKFATGTLTEEALSWWNSFAQPIRIEEAYKITWVEFKKLLIKKYFPWTEIQKIEDEFYHMSVKGNDLKTYVRRFQELATLCPTMVSDFEKLLEAFIEGLPRSIEGNVTTSKPQTLEEAINIAQRLMDQIDLLGVTTPVCIPIHGVAKRTIFDSMGNLGNMMNEVDIENLTNEQYLMLTKESQTQGMVRSEFGSTNLKKTSMVVEMADTTKKAPLRIVENIPKGEYFNPHEVEKNDSPVLEQRTLHYSEERIDIVDSSDDSQEDEVGSHLSEDVVSRWHVCKPVHVTFKVCKEDCGIWPTCNPYLSFCSGYDAIYGKNGMLKQWVAWNYNFNIETTKDNSFKEWVKEGNFERIRDNPYFRNFEVYKEEFDDEIKQLENEYELKAGRKRYASEEVWDKCEKFHDSTKLWYDKEFVEEELWQNGMEEMNYTHPLVKSETFEVHQYTFKNRKSFISVTKQIEDILTLGRVNGSRFIEKTRREMDEEEGATRKM
uniref:Reverse transcriptase domain-containing protein n=1 Tax=Tanacetum cinerariifolium TaxID=118510 RepID=A0A6L2K550_TANCI|nr:reverse transcriptase domain-containing protein [Tanacetum cinerariifolium]